MLRVYRNSNPTKMSDATITTMPTSSTASFQLTDFIIQLLLFTFTESIVADLLSVCFESKAVLPRLLYCDETYGA